jgi:hypothetical protein
MRKSTILFEETTTLASKPGVTLDRKKESIKKAYVGKMIKLLYIMK